MEIGLADECCSSATALARAVRLAAEFASGTTALPRRDWDALAASQQEALRKLLRRDDVREILSLLDLSAPPGKAGRKPISKKSPGNR